MAIEWSPGIGDPTVLGWTTVVAYFVAAALSFKASRSAQFSGRQWQTESMFWACITLAMLALGINKQLDFQSLITELARAWAKEAGWYEGRHAVQQTSIGLLILSAVAAAIGLWFFLRKARMEVKLSGIALCSVLAFVVVRAASFHHVDALIGRNLLGVSWNAILELPGILLIALCAARYWMKVRR